MSKSVCCSQVSRAAAGHGAWRRRFVVSGVVLALAGGLLIALWSLLASPQAARAQGAPPGETPAAAPLTLDWLSQDASATTSAAWGDVDGDGDLDLAVGNANGPNRLYINVSGVLRSDAPGAWTSDESDATTALTWGDVDGDGDLDLAVANGVLCQTTTTSLGMQTRCTPGQERLYRNDTGQLTRRAVWSSTLSDDSRALALGDGDGDGDLDLAVANVQTERGCDPRKPCPQASNRLYRNDGGVFTAQATWTSADTDDSMAVAWANMDDDPWLELVIGGRSGLKVYDNGATGLVTNAAPLASTDAMIVDLATGDIDGDDRLDVVAAGGPGFRRLWLFSNQTGDWQITTSLTSTQSIQALALGDYDADGFLDLALGADCASTRSQCRLQVVRNDQGQFDLQQAWQSDDNLNAAGLAWGDVDGDGDLDLAVGAGNAANQPNRLYRNTSQPLALAQILPQRGDGNPASAAWADVDGDGDQDLALGFSKQCSRSQQSCVPGRLWLYLNEDGVMVRQSLGIVQGGAEADWGDVRALAWSDYDGDGDFDLAVGSDAACVVEGGIIECRWVGLGGRALDRNTSCQLVGGQPQCTAGGVRLLRNEQGVLSETPVWQGMADETVTSLVWGDVDGDGFPDLAAGVAQSCGRDGQGNLVCRDGWSRVLPNISLPVSDTLSTAQPARTLSDSAVWRLPAAQDTSALGWGDVDNDGDPDLVVADRRQRLRLYENAGGVLRSESSWESEQTAETRSLAWGDYDGDGDLDLAVANQDEALHLYRNDGGQLASDLAWTARETNRNPRLAWGDVDGDGDLDLVVNGEQAARLYLNQNGALEPNAAWSSRERSGGAVAWGDMDADGELDLLAGGAVYRNLLGERLAVTGAPRLVLRTPQPVRVGANAGLPIASPQISVTYWLSQTTPDALVDVRGFYSLNGPGRWQPATPLTGTQTTALAGGQHVFVWDAARDGVMGRSDSVVLRLTATSRAQAQPHVALRRDSYGAVSAATQPFPLRGTQVRVMDEASGQPVSGALVFRLPKGELAGAQPLGSEQGPYRTDVNGYLQGSGQIEVGDTLYALLPVTATLTTPEYKVRLYDTNLVLSRDGMVVTGHKVKQSGLQELVVSDRNPLLLFDLALALEWDARNDGTFLNDLQAAIRRSSEVFFDVTNGQMALGEVLVYQNKQNWSDADVVLYANNSIRPRASLGGIVDGPVDDVVRGERVVPLPIPPGGTQTISATRVITGAFQPGQIRMGPVWDPYGESRAELQQDWWRAFAHEFGHYMLYLPDNYLGYNDDGAVVWVDCHDSFMTTAYSDDYSEFLSSAEWQTQASCARTIAAKTTGRSDWQTIKQYYPMVDGSGDVPGPAVLPLDVTKVWVVEPDAAAVTQPARNFDLRRTEADGGGRLTVDQGQAYLIRTLGTPFDLGDDEIVALGATGKSDSIKVRGAAPKDRVCVFDTNANPPLVGCKNSINAADPAIFLAEAPGWQPDITVSPASQLAMVLTVTQTSTAGQPLVQTRALLGPQPVLTGTLEQTLTVLPVGAGLDVGIALSPTLAGDEPELWAELLGGAAVADAGWDDPSALATAVVTPTRPAALQPVTLLHQQDGPLLALALTDGGVWVQQLSGPSIAVSVTQQISGAQPAVLHIYRPALAVEVRQPGLRNGVTVQVYPALRLPNRRYAVFSPFATLRTPVDAQTPDLYRTVIPLDYPVTSGHVRVRSDGKEAVSQFYLSREASAGGGLSWGGQPGYGLGVDSGLGLGPDDRLGLGPDNRLGLGPDNRLGLGPDNRLGLGPDNRMGLGPDNRLGLGPDNRLGLGPDNRLGLGPDNRLGLGPDNRLGLGPDNRLGLGPDNRLGLGADFRALGADRRSFDAPIASEDGQVTIFNRADVLGDPGVLSLQSLASIPNRPDWLRPVGRAYRFVAQGDQQRSIGFQYLRREVPDGYEHTLKIFHSPDEGVTWQRLPTNLYTNDNLATAPADASGLYMLAAVVDLPLPSAGWNLFAYPLPETRLITEALKSLADSYTTVFGYDSTDLNDPWKVYDRLAPPWTNDLKELRFGDAYWISMTQPSLLQLAVAQAQPPAPDAVQVAGQTSSLARRAPPAVYYGRVLADQGVAPATPGALVVASVVGEAGNEEPCGSAVVTLAEDGQTLRYVLKVQAADVSGNSGCGSPGRRLSFTVGGRPVAPPSAAPLHDWDNTRPHELDLVVQ